MLYKVNEIFHSLQGEGFHTGTAAVFVRFSGCNLACEFCDTIHQTYSFMSEEEIIKVVSRYSVEWVILTGGEPGLQVTEQLVDSLHLLGKRVAIETNGTCMLPQNLDWITLSPKMWEKTILTQANELKVVFMGDSVEQWLTKICAPHLFLQPCSCKNTQTTVQYILKHPHWRLSLQTHKYIGIE